MSNLVLFHKNCTDGRMSGFLLHLYFRITNQLEDTEFLEFQYGDAIPDFTGKDVYVVDLSIKPEILQVEISKAKSFLMLDHHKSAIQDYKAYAIQNPSCLCHYNSIGEKSLFKFLNTTEVNHSITFDKDKSGAGLTLDYVKYNLFNLPNSELWDKSDKELFNKVTSIFDIHPRWSRIEKVALAVEDRDLWKFKYFNTQAIYELLQTIPTFEQMFQMLVNTNDDIFHSLVQTAEIRVQMRNDLAKGYATKAKMITFEGHLVPIVNVPSNFSSIVGDILNVDQPFAFMYILDTQYAYCSLRSRNIDVSEIARKRGGGGHAEAAGFKITVEQLFNLFKENENV